MTASITPLPSGRSKTMPVYADYQATTPPDARVVEAMMPFWQGRFGNAHASGHAYGWAAEEALEIARAQVAASIGAQPKEIIFTSGATEANNLALRGIAAAYYGTGKRHIITQETEHKCILASCQQLEREGWQVTYLPVNEEGLVAPNALVAAIREDTLMVSIMAVNNEIGTIQPLAEIGAICADAGVLLHSDAAQAWGKISLDVGRLGVAAMSLSGHKAYAPQGMGVLYLRRRPKVMLEAMMLGGGQERGYRSGTVPLALAVGMGKAAEIAMQEMETEARRLKGYFKHIMAQTVDKYASICLNGSRSKRWWGNINLRIEGVEESSLLMKMKGIAGSSGSACGSGSAEPSYVLRAIGHTPSRAEASARIGIGRFTSEADIEAIIEAVLGAVR